MTNTIVHRFISTTPPITRILVALTIITSLSVYFEFLKPQSIGYSRFYLTDFQFYRMFTSFFYYGKNSFELIMNFIFLYRYSSILEESYGRMSDYFYTLLLVFIALIISSTFFYLPFLATPLSNTITYIWSRKNPQGLVQIFGFVSFSAFYLPFVFPLVSLIFEGRIPKEELVGIVIGQIIYYLRDVYPKIGSDYFGTPCWLHKLFRERCDKCKKNPVKANSGKKISNFTKSSTVEDQKNINTDNNNVDHRESMISSDLDIHSNKIESHNSEEDLISEMEFEESLPSTQQPTTSTQKGEIVTDMSEIAQELHNLENKDSSSEDINESIHKGEVKALESEDEFENIEISEEQSKNSTTKESEEEFESFQFEEMSNDFDSEVSGEIEEIQSDFDDHGNMQSQLYNSSSKNSQNFTNYNEQNFDFDDFEEELENENTEAQSNGNNWSTQDQIEDVEPENKSSVEGQSDFNSESLESENDTTFSNQPLNKITGQKMADSKLFFEDLCSDTVNSEISHKNVKNDKSKDSEDQDSWESL